MILNPAKNVMKAFELHTTTLVISFQIGKIYPSKLKEFCEYDVVIKIIGKFINNGEYTYCPYIDINEDIYNPLIKETEMEELNEAITLTNNGKAAGNKEESIDAWKKGLTLIYPISKPTD
ncbi:hypothetical protein RhiirC2_787000 [Rhizophagus irregularis]|uniref:Uncharacterized protein n=1 Tax=Rhizophagus irregularis TaxID=588596 RepID=A0A2N1MT23_9GLOM|nr:hypothetical protein RhiirC2_787000 [Rhizophagus irregularis]